MVDSPGSFLARESLPSATPFAVLAAVVASSPANAPSSLCGRASLVSSVRSSLVTLRRGWACGATLAPSAIFKRDAHPRLRLDHFEGGCRKFGSSIWNRRAIPKVSSLRSKWFGEASSLAECSGWLVPRHLPPQTPLRCALHTLPALRPPQAAASLPGMRFGNVGREIEPCWLAQAPRPGFHVVFRSFLPAHHVPAPVPPPSAYGVKCCPRRSRRFRVPSFVPHCVTCAAWSLLRDHLTPQTPAAEGHYRFGFAKTSWVNLLGDDQTGSGQRLNPVES